jgi:hypothetical protein
MSHSTTFANLSAPAPRIEAAIRQWEEARRREAVASRLHNETVPGRPAASEEAVNAWYDRQFEALCEATAEVVQRLRESGLRALRLNDTLYADVSTDLDVFDFDEPERWKLAAIPLGKVAGLA